ncbi:MAG: creatininase family protein [Chloroflexi bacterium]|nr:creatininase family protein [Chloroflexota bacterium]
MPKVRYEEMLPHEIVAARTRRAVAYLPIGTLEWHGEHLCVGNDAVKAHAMAVRLAEEGGGLVFPALFWGENRESNLMEADHDPEGKIAGKMGLPRSNFAPGYMETSPAEQDQFYVRLLVHMLQQVESLGFKAIVVLAGHYPLLRHARAAVELYSLRGKARAWAVTGYELVRDEIPDAGDHAAGWETSLLMVLRPDCVDLSRLPADPKDLIGVGGRRPPQQASVEYGERGLRLVMDRILAKVEELLSIAR